MAKSVKSVIRNNKSVKLRVRITKKEQKDSNPAA